MSYPSMDQYSEAVQLPKVAFLDPVLQHGQVAANGFGIPIALGGGFALTYTVSSGGRKFAVRCFHKDSKGLQERYAAISSALRSVSGGYFVGFEYQPGGVRVHGQLYPIVKMDWVQGETLGVWLENHHKDKAALLSLVSAFRALDRFLTQARIAHGDLQNGNILVDGSGIKLIDYDGLFVPGLPTGQGNELGHLHFQHPRRGSSDFGPSMDRFSFIAIDVSLRALAEKPALFQRHSNGENILFSASDYRDPASSSVFADVRSIPALLSDVEYFARICLAPVSVVPSLDDFLAGRNIPGAVVSFPRPAGQSSPVRRLGSYLGAYDVIDGRNYAAALKKVGDRVEVVGRILEFKKAKTKYGKPYVFLNFGPWRGQIVKISIWSEGLAKLNEVPTAAWEGRWISVVGLVEQPYKSARYRYSHLSITVEASSQYRFIDEVEAKRRLGSGGQASSWAPDAASDNAAILTSLRGGKSDSGDRVLVGSPGNQSPAAGSGTQPIAANQQILDQIRRRSGSGAHATGGSPAGAASSQRRPSGSAPKSGDWFEKILIWGIVIVIAVFLLSRL